MGVPSPENAYRRTVDEKFESFPPDALDLVQKLLVVDPLKRLTPAQALEHPFFTNEPRERRWTCRTSTPRTSTWSGERSTCTATTARPRCRRCP